MAEMAALKIANEKDRDLGRDVALGVMGIFGMACVGIFELLMIDN